MKRVPFLDDPAIMEVYPEGFNAYGCWLTFVHKERPVFGLASSKDDKFGYLWTYTTEPRGIGGTQLCSLSKMNDIWKHDVFEQEPIPVNCVYSSTTDFNGIRIFSTNSGMPFVELGTVYDSAIGLFRVNFHVFQFNLMLEFPGFVVASDTTGCEL